MFSAIYVEAEVRDHPRVAEIVARFPQLPVIECQRFGELFNRRAQNFRLQKQAPSLILARKHGKLVLPAPAGYGFEAGAGYYFSHMLNCLYDCRYCFLQGMYRSANYVLFVNFEDFADALAATVAASAEPPVFYSGYDCDSLALEPVSNFCRFILPKFNDWRGATLEIRTKSTQVRSLLDAEPLPNVVVAMSFTAHDAAARWEHRVPAIGKRLEALQKLQAAGWAVALRFEPVLFEHDTLAQYRRLFDEIFTTLDGDSLHSVSAGAFRMPTDFFKNISRLYPDEPLFARQMIVSDGMVSQAHHEWVDWSSFEALLLGYVSSRQYYRCA